MTGWFVYAVEVGLFAVVAAWSADSLARICRLRARFVWLAAALLSIALPISEPMRASTDKFVSLPDVSSIAFVESSVLTVQQRVPAVTVAYVVGLWAFASILVAFCFALVYGRLHRMRRGWPIGELHGHRVRLTSEIGPMVLGIFRPEVIVPQWLLGRSPDEQRVVIAHEVEHVKAGDPLLLTMACTIVALMPWNPACWIILSRLRLAIEIDCDARVLQRGLSPRTYGSLLIDVAESSSPFLFAATGLSGRASHLRSRILAMQPNRFTHPLLRGIAAATLAFVSFLAACESRMPTAADIASMDASSAERDAGRIGPTAADSVVFFVDGTAWTAAAAKQIPADSIASVVLPMSKGSQSILLTTKRGLREGKTAIVSLDYPKNKTAGAAIALNSRAPGLHAKTLSGGLEPMVLIDGVQSNSAALAKLNPNRIDKVEVIKGASAMSRYGEGAKNGVMLITTKGAEGSK